MTTSYTTETIAEMFGRIPEQWFDIPNTKYAGADHRISQRPDADWAEFGHCATVAANYAEFIAAAPTIVRQLLAERDTLRTELAAAQARIKELELERDQNNAAFKSPYGPLGRQQ